LGKVALGDGTDNAGDFRRRLDHVLDELVHGADGTLPATASILHAAALADLAFLADHLGETLEFLRHLLVQGDDFVEEAGDLTVDPLGFFRQANAEVATTERAKRTDELTAIDKVALCLDVHAYISVWLFSPHPSLHRSQPPGRESSHLIKGFALRFLKISEFFAAPNRKPHVVPRTQRFQL
jgi:hypothetical protein